MAPVCSIDPPASVPHRNALSFPDGTAVLVNMLLKGKCARNPIACCRAGAAREDKIHMRAACICLSAPPDIVGHENSHASIQRKRQNRSTQGCRIILAVLLRCALLLSITEIGPSRSRRDLCRFVRRKHDSRGRHVPHLQRGRARRLSIQAILRRLLAEKQFQSWARGADNARSVGPLTTVNFAREQLRYAYS